MQHYFFYFPPRCYSMTYVTWQPSIYCHALWKPVSTGSSKYTVICPLSKSSLRGQTIQHCPTEHSNITVQSLIIFVIKSDFLPLMYWVLVNFIYLISWHHHMNLWLAHILGASHYLESPLQSIKFDSTAKIVENDKQTHTYPQVANSQCSIKNTVNFTSLKLADS